jgi:hypothetical protein
MFGVRCSEPSPAHGVCGAGLRLSSGFRRLHGRAGLQATGRVISNIEAQNEAERQALLTYQKTVLTALGGGWENAPPIPPRDHRR